MCNDLEDFRLFFLSSFSLQTLLCWMKWIKPEHATFIAGYTSFSVISLPPLWNNRQADVHHSLNVFCLQMLDVPWHAPWGAARHLFQLIVYSYNMARKEERQLSSLSTFLSSKGKAIVGWWPRWLRRSKWGRRFLRFPFRAPSSGNRF